ncbi:MAG: sugar transferase [Candidatus Acidiferrales bacterium]
MSNLGKVASNPAPDSPAAQNVPVYADSGAMTHSRFYVPFGKRLFDFFLSLLATLLLAPILVIIAGLVKLSSPGPVFFRQIRVGKDGKWFRILKFRSMVDGAEWMGLGITSGDDPRITRLGAHLRRWKLDELPQLWNVLKGEMSFVGPRPELPVYVARYSDEQKEVLRVRPGITDPASIQYRHEETLLEGSSGPEELYLEKILPHKIALNLAYLKEISFVNDLSLMLSTVKSIVSFSVSHGTR